jgi:hypothetical protein
MVAATARNWKKDRGRHEAKGDPAGQHRQSEVWSSACSDILRQAGPGLGCVAYEARWVAMCRFTEAQHTAAGGANRRHARPFVYYAAGSVQDGREQNSTISIASSSAMLND